MSDAPYQITKEECQASIGKNVCSSCGGKLEPIETVDNSGRPTFWTGCMACCRYDSGVLRETFEIAKVLVERHGFKLYSFDAGTPAQISAMTHCVIAMKHLLIEQQKEPKP